MRIAIVTSIFGNVANLHNPSVTFDSCDYHAFVDGAHGSKN